MKVLPQAMATGYIHMGTITGKLNGVMPGHHAQRLADRGGVDPVGDVLGELALEQVGDAAGELDHLDAPGHLPPGVLQHLAVLGGDQAGQVVAVAVGQLAEGEEDPGPGGERGVPPLGRGGPGPDHGLVDVLRRGQHHLAGLTPRWPGRTPVRSGPRRPRAMIRSAS